MGLGQLSMGVHMVIQVAPGFKDFSTAWMCAAELTSLIPVSLDVLLIVRVGSS